MLLVSPDLHRGNGAPIIRPLPNQEHPDAPILNHTAKHDVLIYLPQGMYLSDHRAALLYGTHASATKEAELVYKDIVEQV